MRSLSSTILRIVLLGLAIVFAGLGAIVVPIYAFFMVVWFHAPFGLVLVTTLPVAVVLLLLSWGAIRLSVIARHSHGRTNPPF